MVLINNLSESFFFKGTGDKIEKIQVLISEFDPSSAGPSQQTVFENYFFVTLYSLWESEVYRVVRDIFQSNSHELTTDKFLEEYYKNIFSSRSKKLKEKFQDLGAEKALNIHAAIREQDLFFDTNNLWYSELKELLKKCDLKDSLLESYFQDQEKLGELLNSKLNSIELVAKNGETRPERTTGSYIDFLVMQRNSIAHSFKSPTGAKYDKQVWLDLLELFCEIFLSLDNFLKDQLLKKMYNNNSPKLVLIDNFEIIANKRANSKKLKIDIKISSGDFEPEEGAFCLLLKEGDLDGVKKIKKFKIIKKDVNITPRFDYRLELEEVYRTGGVTKDAGLHFLAIKP